MSRVLSSRLSAGVVATVVVGAGLVVPVVLAAPASAATAVHAVTATVGVGSVPNGAAVDPSSRSVYVSNGADDTVSVIDGATNQVTATVGVGDNPFGVAVDPTTHTVYVANFGASSVSVIDGTTNQVTATVGVGSSSYALAVDPTTHRVYVASYFDDAVSVIDGATNQVIATVDVGDASAPRAIAVDSSSHTVYVADFNKNSVSVIDGTTNQVTATVAVGDSPIGVAVDPSTHAVYVSDFFSNAVSVTDGATNQVTATVGVGVRPYGVAVDPSTHTVHVANRADSSVSVIDGVTRQTVATLGVGANPVGVGVDESTHTAYATNSAGNTLSVIGRGTTPAVTAVSPASGPEAGGRTVTITGSDLTGATVAFGATPATSFTVDSATQITATAPAGTGTFDVTVTTPFGTSPTSAADHYVYTGPLDHLLLSPSPAGVTAGKTKDFTAQGFDAQGNSLGDVTADTAFTVAGGTCAGFTCTSSTATGTYTVTGADGTATGTTLLTVRPGAFDHLAVAPVSRSIVAGGSQSYRVTAYDVYGNLRGTVTSQATLTVDTGASCNVSACSSTTAGTYTVTASFGGRTATASLRVTPAALDRITLTPPTKTIVTGASQAYRVTAYDAYGNSRGVVSAATSLSVDGGSCANGVCTSGAVGSHTVTAAFGGEIATATLDVRAGAGQTSVPRW